MLINETNDHQPRSLVLDIFALAVTLTLFKDQFQNLSSFITIIIPVNVQPLIFKLSHKQLLDRHMDEWKTQNIVSVPTSGEGIKMSNHKLWPFQH